MLPQPPDYIQLYPTLNCNQRCFFCFNADCAPHADLSFDKAMKLLDILSCNAVKEIDIMGGEPLLLKWMPDFITEALNRDISVNISSNGSIPEMVRKLAVSGSEKLLTGLSLEGSTAERHNSITGARHFDLLLESLKILIAYNLDPVIKTVLYKSSCNDIQNIIDLVREAGAKRFFLLHMDLLSNNARLKKESLSYAAFAGFFHEIAQANDDMDINCVHASCFDATALPENVRCAGGIRKIAVMPDGSVYPCNLLVKFDAFRLGNILKHEFQSIWESPVLDFSRTYHGNTCTVDNCSNRHRCTGGCPAHNLCHYGVTDRQDIRCCL